MLNPVALSIIANAFPAPKDRARAVGIWGAVASATLLGSVRFPASRIFCISLGNVHASARDHDDGVVNPAISNNAVARMPLSQAGVAAAIGVAVSGAVVAMSRAQGTDFTTATHVIWWGMSACGAVVFTLGFASTTAWARASTERVAHLFEEAR
jgi:hypothetical protein